MMDLLFTEELTINETERLNELLNKNNAIAFGHINRRLNALGMCLSIKNIDIKSTQERLQ